MARLYKGDGRAPIGSRGSYRFCRFVDWRDGYRLGKSFGLSAPSLIPSQVASAKKSLVNAKAEVFDKHTAPTLQGWIRGLVVAGRISKKAKKGGR